MRVAIMSDLHDNTKAWKAIARYLKEQDIDRLINCGDTCAPAMLQEMSSTFPGQIDTVFGNVADRELEKSIAATLPNVTHHGDVGTIDVDGKKVFFNHYPKQAEYVAHQGEADLVCHGHTHLKRWEPVGDAMMLNPGTAGGMFQYPSFAIIDLPQMKCSFIDITV